METGLDVQVTLERLGRTHFVYGFGQGVQAIVDLVAEFLCPVFGWAIAISGFGLLGYGTHRSVLL